MVPVCESARAMTCVARSGKTRTSVDSSAASLLAFISTPSCPGWKPGFPHPPVRRPYLPDPARLGPKKYRPRVLAAMPPGGRRVAHPELRARPLEAPSIRPAGCHEPNGS
jgi:hypothetical protein